MDHRDELTADLLKGEQSVRVTFKISEECIRLLSLTAGHLGIQQKRLFDQLFDDRETLMKIAGRGEESEAVGLARVQKTYVLSRRSLDALRETAKSHGIARDALVERSIDRLRPVLDAEWEKRRRWRQAAARFDEFVAAGEKLFAEMAVMLAEDAQTNTQENGGADDPILRQTAEMLAAIHKSQSEIGRLLAASERLGERLSERLSERAHEI